MTIRMGDGDSSGEKKRELSDYDKLFEFQWSHVQTMLEIRMKMTWKGHCMHIISVPELYSLSVIL